VLRDPVAARAFESRVIDRVLGAVRAPATRLSGERRRRLAWRAEAYLRTRLDAALTIHDLCRATGATVRTLHRAFQEQFGTTPKAYLKMLRLRGVRDELRQRSHGTTVTDVALRWGFLHLGWFSRDYRAMFGETPSQTLDAARVHPPVFISG
jgi:AraC family ethanolamine operon transcriptional activator